MKIVKVHPEKSIKLTPRAALYCGMFNTYKRMFPDRTFKEMAIAFQMSETNVRRYYYGVHHRNVGGDCYSQIRQGACVTL